MAALPAILHSALRRNRHVNFWSAPIRILIPGIVLAVLLLFAPLARLASTSDPESGRTIFAYLVSAIPGVLAALFVLILLSYATMFLSSRLFRIPRVPFAPKLTISSAITKRWTLQAPTQGLIAPTMFLIPGSLDLSSRRRYLAALGSPLVAISVIGIIGYIATWIFASDPKTTGFFTALTLILATVMIELIPFRSSSKATVGGVLRWLGKCPDSYPSFVEHNVLAMIEFGAPERPAEFPPELVKGIHDDLLEQCLTADTKIAASRLLYLVATDRHDWSIASEYVRYLHGATEDSAVLPNNRRAIHLLFAFHSAWVDRNWPAAQTWLNESGTTKAMRNTPMYLITNALIARLQDDYRTAAKRLRTADKRTRQFKVVSGTTRFWLNVIDSAYLSLPAELRPRGKRRQVTPLTRLPNPPESTNQPQAA